MTRLLTAFVTAATMIAGIGSAIADAEINPMLQLFQFGSSGGSGPIARTTVNFEGNYAPGTIIVNTAERRLYLVQEGGRALRYGIGVGRDGFRWGGVHRISAKKEWPGWTPPSQMLARRPTSAFHKGDVVRAAPFAEQLFQLRQHVVECHVASDAQDRAVRSHRVVKVFANRFG